MKKTNKAVSLTTMGVAFLLLIGCTEEVQQESVIRPVKTVVLGQPGEGGRRIFPGTVQALQRAQLSFRVSGPLTELPVLQGQQVRRGETLAKIDSRDFETALRNSEARLADLRAQYRAMEAARPEDIRTLEATLAAARARLLETSATLRRYERLYENDNVSKAEYDQRRAAQQVAEAEVRSAEERLQIGRTGARAEDMEAMEARIRAMEAQLAQARDALEDTVLRAPYDGMVAETYVENFEFVQAREQILSLQDVSTVEIVAQIPEGVVARGNRDQLPSFLARFESLPGRDFPATATEIAAEADPATRTYAVTFQTDQPQEANILAGMVAEILLEEPDQSEASFTVPVAAVFADEQDVSYVWALDTSSMTPRRVQVRVGEMVGDSLVVSEGLEAGDEIITAGTHYVQENQPVRRITDELRERR